MNGASIFANSDKTYRSVSFAETLSSSLPSVFQESDIGKDTYIECETPLVPILSTLAKIVGFDVDTCECGDSSVLFFRKPYPYWRYAFSCGKRSVH